MSEGENLLFDFIVAKVKVMIIRLRDCELTVGAFVLVIGPKGTGRESQK